MRIIILCLLILAQLPAEDVIQEKLRDQNAGWYNTQQDQIQRTSISIDTRNDQEGSGATGLYDLLLMFIYGIIIALVIYLVYVFISTFVRHKEIVQEQSRINDGANHVKSIQVSDLPFQTQTPIDNPRAALDNAYQQKDWAHVVIFALLLLLTEFHKSQLLHLRRGKTNRSYLREMRSAPKEFQRTLQLSVQLFEQSFFGHVDIANNQVQQLYKRVCETHQHLQDERQEHVHA